MDDDPRTVDSFRKRLGLQKEILRWLEEFSDKLQKRADEITAAVHGLLEQATDAEVDLKNTFNYFHSLSSVQFVENKAYDGDEVPNALREEPSNSVCRGLPAQSYELDILPRYKEALSLGLSSYREYLQRSSESSSTSSVFKGGSPSIQLPHIFGTEEYAHDNSCGLADDLIMEVKELDINHNLKHKTLRSETGGSTSKVMFNDDIFHNEQHAVEKEESEPMFSAALDFKRMLEAALLSPYKFYEEDYASPPVGEGCSGSGTSANVGQDYEIVANMTTGADIKYSGTIGEKGVYLVDDDVSLLRDPNAHLNIPISALISGGLFDSEEMPLPSGQEQPLSSSYSFPQLNVESPSKLENEVFECADMEEESLDACHGKEATNTTLSENRDRHESPRENYSVKGCWEQSSNDMISPYVKESGEELPLVDDAITEPDITKGGSASDQLAPQASEEQNVYQK